MATPPPPVQFQKKRSSCFGCGCALGLFILLLAILGGIGYFAYSSLLGYTDTVSTPVPQFDGGDAVYATAHKKLIDFGRAIEQGKPSSLHLSSEEINTLIARDPSFAPYRDHLFVTLKDSEADIQASMPLSAIQPQLLANRYLSFEAAFALTFNSDDKTVKVDLHRVHIKNQDLPAGTGDTFNKSVNPILNQKLQQNAAARDFLNRTKTLTIQNGELVIETQ